MKTVAYAALLAALLAGCAQTPDKDAASGAAQTADGKASTAGMGAGQVKEGMLKAPPKDAAGALGQRVVYFDFDSSAIRSEFRAVVEAHSGFMKANGGAKVKLNGHTDEQGSREYNVALGQRRADAVKQAMTVLGVADARVESVSFGEEKPAAEGNNEAAWSKNRRVEIVYEGE